MNYSIQQLFYEDKCLISKEPKDPLAHNANFAIIIHVFYSDTWNDELLPYLNNIKTKYDLYITVPEQMSEEVCVKIFNDHPNVNLYKTENRGRDVLPFLQIMKIVGADTYEIICKLHTKKTAESDLGNVWRKLLYYDLLGSNDIVNNTLQQFTEDTNIAMITGKNTILDSQRYTYGNDEKIQELAQKLDVFYNDFYYFPAGTMFWTRTEVIVPIIALFAQDKLVFEDELGQKDNTLAHAIERFFGILCQDRNKEIQESQAEYTKLAEQTLKETASLVLSQQYAGTNVFAMQKQKIQLREERILELEALADSMRIKNRLKNLFSDKIMPLLEKIKKIPQKSIKSLSVIKNNPTILKKVLYYLKRGEIKYLITKIKEKSNNNLNVADILIDIKYEDYFIPFDKSEYHFNDLTIDIIIPVYNGYEFLEPLFDSVERNTSLSYRLIVINDSSPDERVKPYLIKRLEKHSNSIFIDHLKNQGFLKSVNEAFSHTSNHFVLLNTDTEVPSFWLERLMYPILHMDNIASTTPFTNSGEIASFPNFVADNEIFDNMTTEDLDSVFKNVNPKEFYAKAPTGVGFCMGVNYHVVTQIGMFTEDTFGKGYGEENDWCQRAIKEGYHNLIVPNLFVYHKHGGSFTSEEKQVLLQKNAIKLLERHPDYGKDVQNYIKQNPHRTLRQLLVLMASNHTQAIDLIYDHALGGGANTYINERIEKYLSENRNILLIKYDYYAHYFRVLHTYKTYHFEFKMRTLEELSTLLNHLNIQEVFLNNLVSYKMPLDILSSIDTIIEKNSAKLIIPIHDFYSLCPSYNLINEHGNYCNVPSIEVCKSCMKTNMQEWRNFYDEEVNITKWRESWSTLLQKSSEILCFSKSSKDIFLKAYPKIEHDNILVIPHIVKDIQPIHTTKTTDNTTLTIGILGAINYVKGSNIIKQMIQIIQRDRLNINIVVIGEITESIKSDHFHVTGRYKREDLETIIQSKQIDIFFIPSVWPETFSYTSQEIMMMELPLMVFDLGAPSERVKQYDKGYIIKDISALAALKTIKEIIV